MPNKSAINSKFTFSECQKEKLLSELGDSKESRALITHIETDIHFTRKRLFTYKRSNAKASDRKEDIKEIKKQAKKLINLLSDIDVNWDEEIVNEKAFNEATFWMFERARNIKLPEKYNSESTFDHQPCLIPRETTISRHVTLALTELIHSCNYAIQVELDTHTGPSKAEYPEIRGLLRRIAEYYLSQYKRYPAKSREGPYMRFLIATFEFAELSTSNLFDFSFKEINELMAHQELMSKERHQKYLSRNSQNPHPRKKRANNTCQ